MKRTKINQNQSNENTVLFNTLIGNTQSAHVSSDPPTKLSFHQNNSLQYDIFQSFVFIFDKIKFFSFYLRRGCESTKTNT